MCFIMLIVMEISRTTSGIVCFYSGYQNKTSAVILTTEAEVVACKAIREPFG